MLILEPKKIHERYIKLQQKNKKLLMENEVLEFNQLNIDKSWDFELDAKYIKTKKITGYVKLHLNYIPEWLSNIEIVGYFDCSSCGLTSLKNCPKKINKSFNCSSNFLTILDDGPTYVGLNYFCWHNFVNFKRKYIRRICYVNNYIIC